MKKLVFLLLIALTLGSLAAVTITEWNFEDSDLEPAIGSGEIYLTGGVASDGFGTGYPDTPSVGWSTTNYPLQGTNNLSAGICFEFSTLGFSGIELSWMLRHSNKSANRAVMFYTLDRSANPITWVQAADNSVTAGDTWYPLSFDASGITGFNNNPNLAIKIVAGFGDANNTVYVASKSTSSYGPDGKWRWDDIVITGNPLLPHLELNAAMETFFAAPGALSPLQEYQITGQNLVDNVQISLAQPFSIRLSGSGAFANSLELSPRSGNLNKTIQVLFAPTTSGTYQTQIAHSYPGLEDLTLELTGCTTKPEPSMYPTGFSAYETTYYHSLLTWTDVHGLIAPDGYLILGSKVDAEAIVDPVDGVEYPDKKLTKNVPYGVQSQLIFELNEDHTYYFKIFPYTNSGSAIDYKIDGTPPLISFSTAIGPIGSDLQPGDLAFVEYASDSPDRFSFVLLRDVLENTKISFTDKAWTGTAFAGGEEIYLWRGVGRAYHAGEVIHIVEGVLYPDEGIYNPDFSGFSNDGDQIIAYQAYLTEPSFIAAFSTTGWITEGIPTNNSSWLPEPLILGDTALGFASEIDNGMYHGIRSGTATQLRLAMNDPDNWTRANSLNNINFPEVWNITVLPDASCPTISIIMEDEGILRIQWDEIPAAQHYILYYSENPAADFPSGWQIAVPVIDSLFIDLSISEEATRRFYRVTAEI